MTRILRHLKLASVPPPIAPARIRQDIFAFDDAHTSVSPEARCAPQRCLSPLFALPSRLNRPPPQRLQTGRPEALARGNPLRRYRTPS
jgi:hypothetical protein